MKLVCTGDIHLDEHSRFEETVKVLGWLHRDMSEFRPDVVLVGGDSAPVSVRRMTPIERNTLAEWYQRLADIATVVIVPGNHDNDVEDVRIFQALRSAHSIHVVRRPGMVGEILNAEEHFRVFCVPWPNKGYLMEAVKGQAVADVGQACRDALRMILHGARAEFLKDPTAWKIILGHLNVTGSDAGGFTLVGQDVEVAAEDLLAVGADLVLLSHIHKAQEFYGSIHYPGSPRYIDFGEENEVKGYKRVTLERGRPPLVEFRPTEGLTPLQTIRVGVTRDATIIEGRIADDGTVRCQPDSEIRVIIDCDEHRRASINEAALLQDLGADRAKSVRVEWRIRPTQRVRVPEIQQARTDADRLRAYLGTLQPPPDGETIERLLLKLSLIGSVM